MKQPSLVEWAKKLTKRESIEILRKVNGEWHTVDIPHDEMVKLWDALKDKKPFFETCSLHVSEDRYRYQNKTYHVYWQIGKKTNLPMSIGIRTSYEWDKKLAECSNVRRTNKQPKKDTP